MEEKTDVNLDESKFDELLTDIKEGKNTEEKRRELKRNNQKPKVGTTQNEGTQTL